MTATLAIVQVTARNMLGLKRLIGFGLLASFPGFMFMLTSRQASEAGRLETFSIWVVTFLAVCVPIITVVISSSVLGSERRENTLSFLMLRPISRFAIAAAKLASAIAASFVVCAIGAVVLGVAGSIAMGDFGYLIGTLAGGLLANAGYAAVFMLLGLVTERSTLIGFIYIVIWEGALTGILSGLTGTAIWRIAASGMVSLSAPLDQEVFDAARGDIAAGAGGAALKMLVVCAASIAITGYLLRSRDLT